MKKTFNLKKYFQSQFDIDDFEYKSAFPKNVPPKRDIRKADPEQVSQQIIDKLDYYDKARQISDQATEDLGNNGDDVLTKDPVKLEANRILSSLTHDEKIDWLSAYYPEYDVVKQDQLKQQINLPQENQRSDCMRKIINEISEMPEFKDMAQVEGFDENDFGLSPEDEAYLAGLDDDEDADEVLNQFNN